MRAAILLLLALLCLQSQAQNEGVFEPSGTAEPKTYEIGNIKVIGANFSDEEAIIAVSGLKVGQQIQIPGIHINKAMKSIWDLKLFKDLEIRKAKTIDDVVFLEIEVFEFPRIGSFQIKNIKKSYADDLRELITGHLVKGHILTENNKQNAIQSIRSFYEEKGYPNAVVKTRESLDNKFQNTVQITFDIDKRNKVKVMLIQFSGNKNISARRLKKLMGFTNEKKKLFKKSILTEDGFTADKKRIIAYYKSKGFQDAKIIHEQIKIAKEGDWVIKIKIEEGQQYFIRNIYWKGNTKYTSAQLEKILCFKKGDVYNTSLLAERLHFSQDGRDISALYTDNGHLFFNITHKELLIEEDSVDLEIKILEGPVATIGKVIISGNTITKDEVIRRELRTLPGDRFSRAAILRSQREIINLGYFNPEALDIKTHVHPELGTVDIEYIVEEKPNDQFELSMGFDPASKRLIGTAGVSFNNISIKNFFKKSAWNPFPRGDGQRLSLRLQSTGKQFQSYNFSFTDPWLGGKEPKNLTVGGFFTNRTYDDSEGIRHQFNIFGGTVNLSKRMKWPDDNFISSTSLNFNRITLDDWTVDGFQLEDGTPVSNGVFNNLYLKQTFARNTLNHPIFPTRGSNLSWEIQVTPPYSLFGSINQSKDPADRYNWLEYYKTRVTAEWYVPLTKKLVLKTSGKIGLIGAYNKDLGLSPFERFWFGGNGYDAQQGFTGIDLISMRGYNATSDFPVNGNGGATAFGKFSAELRYPLVKSNAATIYGIAFGEIGNAWGDFQSINPFDMKKSAGLGLRVHLPMFGTLGFDYGIGFDKDPVGDGGFLSRYGQFNIILGFEPD